MESLQDYAMNLKIKFTKTFIPKTIEFASLTSKGTKIYSESLKD